MTYYILTNEQNYSILHASSLKKEVVMPAYEYAIGIMQLFRVRDEDVEDLNALFVQINPGEHVELPGHSQWQHVADTHRLIVLRSEAVSNRTIGMAILAKITLPQGTIGRVYSVVIDERARGRKLGNALMGCVVAFAKLDGMIRIDLESRPHHTAAHSLYKKFGFVERDTHSFRLQL